MKAVGIIDWMCSRHLDYRRQMTAAPGRCMLCHNLVLTFGAGYTLACRGVPVLTYDTWHCAALHQPKFVYKRPAFTIYFHPKRQAPRR